LDSEGNMVYTGSSVPHSEVVEPIPYLCHSRVFEVKTTK